MKLTAILLLGGCLQLSARGISQSINLSVTDAPLIKVFQAIEQQTEYTFFVKDELLKHARNVTIKASNLSVQQVLDLCFKDQPLKYAINGKIITIAAKNLQVEKDKSTTAIRPNSLIDIKGRIINSNGEPVSGATVTAKGTTRQTVTNSNGEFLLNGVDDKAILVISHIQYETLNLSLNGNSFVSATLQVRIKALDELQVIAYGTTTKRFSTGNVSSVKANDIQNQPVNNPLLALEGRVPGLFITQSTGLPGSGVSVRIQGQNSLGKGNDPFYVIDGVPYVSQTLPTVNTIVLDNPGSYTGSNTGAGNPLSFINPSDIESIEILKDADATAIYGSRAANGAILITTKKGKAGQTRVNIDLQNGWGKLNRKLNLLNTQQYLEARYEAKQNDNAAITTTDYDINGVWDTTRYTDWQKELLGGIAKYTNAQIAVSGGNDLTQFLISGTFHRETTVFPGDFSDKKGALHFNINNTSSNRKFKIQLSGNYLVDDNKLPSSDFTSTALQLAPDAPRLYTGNGEINWEPLPNGNSTWGNPLGVIMRKYNLKTNNLVTSAMASYQLLPGLDVKTNFGFTRMETSDIQLSPANAVTPESRPTYQRSTLFGKSSINSWILEPQINYNINIWKGKLDALIGTTFQENKSNVQQLTATGFNSDLVMEDISSAATITPKLSVISNYKYSAVFGRLNYNLLNKYLVNFTARRDGSSRFGSENLFNNFWSIAGAWVFSNEQFITQNIPFLSFGKFRASFGTTGNDQIGDYQFLNRYQAVSTNVAYQGVNSLEPVGISNPYLQWEETKKLQFGLDLGVLKERIILSANYSYNRSSNQLLGYPLPIVTGVLSFTANFPATIQNTGWEISLNTDNLQSKNFKWTTYINLTIPKNKLVEFPNIEKSTSASTLVVGQPFTIVKKYHFLGVDPATGVYIFSDFKGNPTSNPNLSTDRNIVINTSPKFYGGIQNTFSYKGVEVSSLFQFVNQMGANYALGNNPGSAGNQPLYIWQRWQKPGDISNVQRYTSNTSLFTSSTNAKSYGDLSYSDASYVRLKNIALSWQLPQSWLKKVHMNSVRIYSLGQNLYTWTNYKGLDPENRSTTSLPPLRVITLGLQIGF